MVHIRTSWGDTRISLSPEITKQFGASVTIRLPEFDVSLAMSAENAIAFSIELERVAGDALRMKSDPLPF